MWTLRQTVGFVVVRETKRVRNVPLKKLHCFNAVGQKARSVCSELSPSERPSACVCASFVFPLLQAKTKWTPASHLNWASRRDGRRARGRACGRTRWDSGGVGRGQRSRRSADFEEFGSRCFLAASSTAPRHTPTPSAAAAEDAPSAGGAAAAADGGGPPVQLHRRGSFDKMSSLS